MWWAMWSILLATKKMEGAYLLGGKMGFQRQEAVDDSDEMKADAFFNYRTSSDERERERE